MFAGPSFHSAQWRHDVDLAGKRVAVVGTGASAIQFVPRIRRDAAHVRVFQRSAPYVVPKLDRSYTRAYHAAFVNVPGFAAAMREAVWQMTELLGLALTRVAPLARLLEALATFNLKRRIKDPTLRAKLTPDYPIGCKRVLFSSDWYPALAMDDVDVETDAITEVTTTGVRTAHGRLHDVDVIIFGTGFKATEFLAPITISGWHGCDLYVEWSEGARAHLGMAVPGFPNMFLIYLSEHQPRQQFDHPDDGAAGRLHPPGRRRARPQGYQLGIRDPPLGGRGLCRGGPGPPRRGRLDRLRILVSSRLWPGNHQLAGPGP